MTVGPLRRLVGTLGLLALSPTAALLAFGRLSPQDAALRALATFGLVLFAGRIADWWLAGLATRFERDQQPDAAPTLDATPRRRRSDVPAA